MTNNFDKILVVIPLELKEELKKTYLKIIRNFRQHRFETAELNAGKFSEVVYRILEWHTSSTRTYTPFGTSIRNFGQSCRKFENKSLFPDSVRFHIPNVLISIYNIRNKRGVGHVGGDINPNSMDSTYIVYSVKWILCELIRIFNPASIKEAEELVQNIISKEISIVWEVDDKKRILDTKLKYFERTLVMLYFEYPKPVLDSDLINWLEYSNPSIFKKKILKQMHDEKLIEYSKDSNEVTLSPIGIIQAEEILIRKKS